LASKAQIQKLKNLEILLYVKQNLPKFIPACKYALSPEEYKKQVSCFLPFEMSDKDWDFFFKLQFNQVMSAFSTDQEIMDEIHKLRGIINKPPVRRKRRKKNENNSENNS
jgi:hypothetical protein